MRFLSPPRADQNSELSDPSWSVERVAESPSPSSPGR